jgi:hypothetical protein
MKGGKRSTALREQWPRILVSGTAAALLLVHLFVIPLRPDAIALGLAALAALPWLMGQIKSAEIPGGFKVEFWALKERVEQQDEKLADQQEVIRQLVIYSLSESNYIHLWHIHGSEEYLYRNEEWFRRQMYFLSDNGYLQPRHASFLVFDETIDGRNLVEIAKLTPVGEFLVRLRGKPR